MEQSTNISSLPEEIIAIIYNLLSKDDRIELSLVSKRFLAIYKYKANFKFTLVLNLCNPINAACGMKILREKCSYHCHLVIDNFWEKIWINLPR